MRPRPRAAAALLATAMLAFAGCGGGGGDDTGTTAAPTSAGTTTAEVSEAQAAKVKALIARARQPQGGTSAKQAMRIADAQAELLLIAQSNPTAIAPLLAPLKKPDYDEILDLYNFYIQLGRPGSEKVLIAALDHEGFSERSTPVAIAYLASGNKQLIAGARRWAADRGLTITGQPPAGARWGQIGAGTPSVPGVPSPAP